MDEENQIIDLEVVPPGNLMTDLKSCVVKRAGGRGETILKHKKKGAEPGCSAPFAVPEAPYYRPRLAAMSTGFF